MRELDVTNLHKIRYGERVTDPNTTMDYYNDGAWIWAWNDASLSWSWRTPASGVTMLGEFDWRHVPDGAEPRMHNTDHFPFRVIP